MTAAGLRRLHVASLRGGSSVFARQRAPPRATTINLEANHQARAASSLPTVAQPSFWKSMIPKPLRQSPGGRPAPTAAVAAKSKEWNPATFYIFIFLFIGSMSIQMISLKKDFETYMRKSETKIGLLREVVERLQRGEDVDVERVLGTGDPEKEVEWEDVLKEIERDEVSRTPKRQDRRATATTAAAAAPNKTTPEPTVSADPSPAVKVASTSSFY
ncbi:hypothetical protein SPI_02511 [Niveomyces insectorum RCEF 264]|uniref:Uncharacterized protein n=1 Tax=Niveomyces insectorum RCEF 264 TaxID=1081102 RepID=A0A167Y1V0_9HYPO|nr:hypothetical protein SPI_02511 [Niveomyces insectorum RCEF 264]